MKAIILARVSSEEQELGNSIPVKKAVPSKVVTALINEKLIVLKGNSQNRRFLISKIWLPILRLLRTDWFKDMRDLAPALDSLIRPLLLTHAH